MSRNRIALGLVGLSLLLMLLLLVLFFIPIGTSTLIDENGATGSFSVSRRFLAAQGNCLNASWNVDGIRFIRINGVDTVGADQTELCINETNLPALQIGFADDTETEIILPVLFLVQMPLVWVGGLTALLSLLIAGALALLPRSGRVLTQLGQIAVTVVLGLLFALLLLEGMMRLYISLVGTEQEKLIYLGSAQDLVDANSWAMGMPFLNYITIPGTNGMNEMGFRNDVFEVPKPDGTFRILALGGSTTYGFNVEREQSYPNQMQQILREQYGYTNVEVVNAGIPSYATMNSLINFQTRGLEQEPDLVIVYHAVNDAMLRWQSPECYRGMNALRGMGNEPIWGIETPQINPSTMIRYMQINLGLISNPADLEWRFQYTGLCATPNEPDVDLTQRIAENPPIYFERNLRHIKAIASVYDIPVLFLTQPMNYLAIEEVAARNDRVWASLAVAQPENNVVVAEVAATTDSLFFDFAAEFEYTNDDWLIDHTHLKPDALRRQAEAIATFLHDNNIIPVMP